MIDGATIICSDYIPQYIESLPNNCFSSGEVLFKPKVNDFAQIQYYEAGFRNLHLKYLPNTDRIIIRNSLHKFHIGNNYSYFSLSSIKSCLEELSDLLHVSVFDGTIKRLEYGVNICVENLDRIINSLASFRGTEFEPMRMRSKNYGRSCDKTQYRLKAYDKSLQVSLVDGIKIPPGLLRWEIAAKRMEYLKKRHLPIRIERGQDLCDFETMQRLADDLINRCDQCIQFENLDLSKLSLTELRIVGTHLTSKVKNEQKKRFLNSHKRDCSKLKKILRHQSDERLNVKQLLIERCHELLNS